VKKWALDEYNDKGLLTLTVYAYKGVDGKVHAAVYVHLHKTVSMTDFILAMTTWQCTPGAAIRDLLNSTHRR
jgi:hypothetical protein